MKRFLTIALFISMSLLAAAQVNTGFYIVIDGRPATEEQFKQVQSDTTAVIHFLPADKAIALFGPVAAKGALLITTSQVPARNQVFMQNGRQINPDSIDYSTVKRIDVLRGQQAISLFGVAGKDGVFLMGSDEKPFERVVLRLTDHKGKPVRKAEVINENGIILAKSDKCGWVVLENFSPGNTVTISAGKKHKSRLVITQPVMNVKL